MICTRHAFANSGFHQAAQRWEHIDWRINLTIVQRTVNKDLTFRDVSSQVWNGVCDIVIGHCEDGELRDGAIPSFDTAGALVNGGHVGQDDKDVLLASVGKVLCSGQGQSWSHNAFNCRVIRQVHEQHNIFHGSVFLKVVPEETSGLHVDTHGAKHDAEVLSRVVHDVFA